MSSSTEGRWDPQIHQWMHSNYHRYSPEPDWHPELGPHASQSPSLRDLGHRLCPGREVLDLLSRSSSSHRVGSGRRQGLCSAEFKSSPWVFRAERSPPPSVKELGPKSMPSVQLIKHLLRLGLVMALVEETGSSDSPHPWTAHSVIEPIRHLDK